MEIDRKRVLLGYWIVLVGFLLAFLVAGVVPRPAPPACYTATCDVAYGASLAGLFLLIAGLAVLASALFRGPARPAVPSHYSPGEYSFTGSLPSATPGAPAARAAPTLAAPGTRTCAGCGASVTSEYGFCPRCGRTLSP